MREDLGSELVELVEVGQIDLLGAFGQVGLVVAVWWLLVRRQT